jgi:hypothetical protein
MRMVAAVFALHCRSWGLQSRRAFPQSTKYNTDDMERQNAWLALRAEALCAAVRFSAARSVQSCLV